MKKLFIISLVAALINVSSGLAQSRRKQTSSLPRTATVTNIRQVDFKNFKYFVEAHTYVGRFNKAQWIHLRNGSYNVFGPGHGFVTYYVMLGLDMPTYGDLTGDGREEAAVTIFTGASEAPGDAEVRIYTLKNGLVELLATLKVTENSLKRDLKNVRIEDNLLVIKTENHIFESNEVYIETARYHLDSARFIQVGSIKKQAVN